MQPLTQQQVLALAPDAASATAGQGLCALKKWTSVGRSGRAVWGLCQGSGKDPYQIRVDLTGPAFKCNCPSRKFPCKHGLGLMLLWAKEPSAFKEQDEPGWVSEWIEGRAEKQEKKVEKAKAVAEKPVDLEAQAKRAAQRDARVREGVAGCRLWLDDLLRRGLAAARSGSALSEMEKTAARLVDAQAPGLAGYVRRTPELLVSGDGWEARILDHLSRLHLLLAAAEQLGSLPPELGTDVRTALGYTQSKDEVLAAPGVQDRWCVIAQLIEEEDRLRSRRTWLLGRGTGRRALVLDFAAGLQPLDTSLVAGVEFEGEVGFYPSRLPQRALIKSRDAGASLTQLPEGAADGSIEAALSGYAGALAQQPWMFRWPMVLAGGGLVQHGSRWLIADSSGAALPISPAFARTLHLWRLLSATSGRPALITGEWDGENFLPLSVITPAGYEDVAPRGAA
ncbi:MAG TPA: hypothetical protein VD997_13070 [Phycisphaerales bacterium]|nr:hypothetical protein [Phycisphaerales bacterium]